MPERGSYKLNRAHSYLRTQNRMVKNDLANLRDAIRDAFVDDGKITQEELPAILLHLADASDHNATALNIANLLDEQHLDAADAEINFAESSDRRRKVSKS